MQTPQTVTMPARPETDEPDNAYDVKVSVIIPTMNEPAISKVVKETRQALKHFDLEIIVVDKSTDDTPKNARKAGAQVIAQEHTGYGNAYLVGFRNVSPDTDIAVMMDGDYTYDPFEIPLLLDPIMNDHTDIVLGNRFMHMEEGAMNLRNKLGNGIITGTINTLYRLRLHDSQTGFRAIRRSALDAMDVYSDGMPFASEMIIDARKKSIRILEVPIRYRRRIGQPKLKAYKDGSRIISLIVRMVRDYNPLTIFLPIGGLLMIGGVIVWLSIIMDWLTTGEVRRLASVVGGTMILLSGLQIIFFGLLADIILVAIRSKR